MPYVVVSFKGEEVGRWPLEKPLTVGRSTECEVFVRDPMLSRQHCRVEPYRNGWVAVDLDSRNGTHADGGVRIARRGLADGDVIRMGKTAIRFRVGRLPAGHKPPRKRPADPFEAMSDSTLAFDPAAVLALGRRHNLPAPRPVPREPDAYERDDLYGLLTGVASSSWDSIYAQASQPRRPIPHFDGVPRGRVSRPAAPTPNGRMSATAAAALARRPRVVFADELQVPVPVPRVEVEAAGPVVAVERPARGSGWFTRAMRRIWRR